MDTCIVCLGDLRTAVEEPPPPAEAPASSTGEARSGTHAKRSSSSSKADAKSLENDEEAIAHLLPCKHDLHNACLKPWVERANSCPICRATFNIVELCEHLHGPAISSYAVQDKSQEAEVDPTMIVEDELFAADTWEPCVVCGTTDESETMYCDRCEAAVHVFCAGFDQSPAVWYCPTCLRDMDNGASARRRPRQRAPTTRNRGRRNDALWARIWQEVSRTVDLDLDFPFDDEPTVDQRTPEQRREFARWQRRFEVANQQGATERLRNMANARSRPSNHALEPVDPESQEEIRAWNAFDKARESLDAPANLRRRKRRRTDSPAEPAEPERADQPPQKRPRLRRPPGALGQAEPAAESSSAAAQRAGGEDGPNFLSSLLREVECKPHSASSPGASSLQNGQMSPRESSPEMSPMSSGAATPREGSTTPPPPHTPLSPPLSATNIPPSSPVDATFSPFSPTAGSEEQSLTKRLLQYRGRQRSEPHSPSGSDAGVARNRNVSSSPSRGLSYSAKEEIQRMVKAALKPHYRAKSINKDEYTDINRDVSRKLYDMVRDASALSNQRERERFQDAADEAVANAVSALEERVFLE